ncbi:hypothetical protein ACFLUS_04185 [Chloroflexota bacterium]
MLPNKLAGTKEIVHSLAQEVSVNTHLNIMAQYHPCHKAYDIPQLSRPLNREEFKEAIELSRQ